MTQTEIKTGKILVEALAATELSVALPIVDEYLIINASDGPPVSLHLIEGDAAFWAESCTPTEARCYLGKLIKRLGYQPLGLNSKKHLFVDLWKSFPDTEKRAFISKVSGGGLNE